ncbi:MAG: hypothetical protein LBK25_00580 [Treponema sp.]|jgi:hypothetical protein|nr:hypothetical protein [Treponema sp.]
MKRKAFIALFLLLFALIVAVVCSAVFGSRKKVEEKKEKELQELKDVLVPLRFREVERSGGTIKAEFYFYSYIEDDIDRSFMSDVFEKEQPVNSLTLELDGEELFIDCLRFVEKQGDLFKHDVNWVFPYRVFTDTIAPDNGILIYDAYDSDGFPLIYDALNLEGEAKQRVSDIFSQIKQYGNIASDSELRKIIAGNAVHDISRGVLRFQLGRWYDLIVHIKKGGVEYVAE